MIADRFVLSLIFFLGQIVALKAFSRSSIRFNSNVLKAPYIRRPTSCGRLSAQSHLRAASGLFATLLVL
jgi:hypothetical protein